MNVICILAIYNFRYLRIWLPHYQTLKNEKEKGGLLSTITKDRSEYNSICISNNEKYLFKFWWKPKWSSTCEFGLEILRQTRFSSSLYIVYVDLSTRTRTCYGSAHFPGISDADRLITAEKGTLKMMDRTGFWESTGEVNTITWSTLLKYSSRIGRKRYI